MRILSVNAGRSFEADWAGTLGRTAIDKRPVSHRVEVTRDGLAGDERADTKHHGSPDHAVYSYAREDYEWWESELGRPLRAGQFGENLTTSGIDVNGALLGERWRVGTAVLEVTGPRIPCLVFRNWMDEPGWLKRFAAAGRTGAYLRVVEPGALAEGDEVEIVFRPEGDVTVTDAFKARHGDKNALSRILAIPDHDPKWDALAARTLTATAPNAGGQRKGEQAVGARVAPPVP